MAYTVMEYKPAMAMIAVQCIYAAVSVCSKAVFKEGTLSPAVFVVYRQAVASVVLVPATIILRRGCMPQLSMGWRGYSLVFVASLIGVTLNQNFYFQGLHLTTSPVATAMINLVPAITFVIAVFTGLEKVALTSLRSMAKVFGTIVCVGGAISMGLFRGPKLFNLEFPRLSSILNPTGDRYYWIIGFLFLTGCTCFCSLSLILQVPICKRYLDPLSLSAWMCLLGTGQSAILAFFLVPHLEAWKITSILEILSCLFVGIFGSGVTFYLQSWTISVRGPLFTSMFNPLCTVITTIVSVPLLHDEIHIGSLVGTVAVVGGLYVVLWGKAKEYESTSKPEENSTAIQEVERGYRRTNLKEPLLTESLTGVEGQIN